MCTVTIAIYDGKEYHETTKEKIHEIVFILNTYR